MDLSKHGGSAYEFPGGGGPEGRDSGLDKANHVTMNKVHPEGKYKVSTAHDVDIDDATNVSDTVQTIGSSEHHSEASVANPNISID